MDGHLRGLAENQARTQPAQEAAEGGGSQEEGVTQLEHQALRHQRGGTLPGFSDPNPRKCFWNESKYKETSLMTQK